MAKEKGRRTPKKNAKSAPKGEAWEDATGRSGLDTRTMRNEHDGGYHDIVSHRAHVEDPAVSYAMGKVARS